VHFWRAHWWGVGGGGHDICTAKARYVPPWPRSCAQCRGSASSNARRRLTGIRRLITVCKTWLSQTDGTTRCSSPTRLLGSLFCSPISWPLQRRASPPARLGALTSDKSAHPRALLVSQRSATHRCESAPSYQLRRAPGLPRAPASHGLCAWVDRTAYARTHACQIMPPLVWCPCAQEWPAYGCTAAPRRARCWSPSWRR
jgi:hypothetical protein